MVSGAVLCRYVVDAVWSDWTEWTVCTATCGDAGTQSSSPVLIQLTCRLQQVRRPQSAYHRCTVRTQSRWRTCTAGRHGGLDCVGDDTETRACNEQPCPGTQPYRPTDRPTTVLATTHVSAPCIAKPATCSSHLTRRLSAGRSNVMTELVATNQHIAAENVPLYCLLRLCIG